MNNFAISSSGIGTALQKSAAALHTAGNDINESIGLAVAANNVLQNPEVVGTILKTSSMYLRAAKTDAEAAGEATDGMANSVSELRDEILNLTKQKVDIMIDDTTFKSTFQQYKELSAIFKELSDVDQANLLELMGGKRNATGIASILLNFDDAVAAYETAIGSAGSATKENEKYLDSISGKISILTSSFQSLSASILDSSFVKKTVDGLTWITTELENFLKLINKIPGASASFNVLSGVLGGVLGAKGKGNSNEYALYLSNRVDAKAIKLRGSQNIISPKRSWKRQVAMVWKHRKNEMINLCCKKTA